LGKIITNKNYKTFIEEAKHHGTGLIARDYSAFPLGYYAQAVPFTLPLIPEHEWEERLKDQIAAKAQLSNIRDMGNFGQRIPSTDQGKQGYCWAFSTVNCCLLLRAANNQPYIGLSAYAVACLIKNYKDEGGWCQLSLAFLAERGVPSYDYWPPQSKDPKNDNPETWINAKKHTVSEWYDLDPRNMRAQMVTCLLMGIPVAGDFQWAQHSVCVCDLVSIRPFRIRFWNSWSDQWGTDGMGIAEEDKAIPNGACAPRNIYASKE